MSGSDLREEIWKDIKGYEGKYQISNTGYVKSLDFNHTGKEKILKNKVNYKGYCFVTLYKENKQYYPAIHRLVAEAFIPNSDCLPQVNHIDGNKCNNHVENLEWCTNLENMHHAIKTGLTNCRGNIRAVEQIDSNGKVINKFGAIADAGRFLGIKGKPNGISRACSGKQKTAYGYRWKYSK